MQSFGGGTLPIGVKRSHTEAFGASEEHAFKWHVTDRQMAARSPVACQASWDKTKEKLFQGSKQYYARIFSPNQQPCHNQSHDEVTPMNCQEDLPAQSQRNITSYFSVTSSKPEPMSCSAGPQTVASKPLRQPPRQYTLSSTAGLADCFSVLQSTRTPPPTLPAARCCLAAGRVGLTVSCGGCLAQRCHDCVRLCHACAATLCAACVRDSYDGDETKVLCLVCR